MEAKQQPKQQWQSQRQQQRQRQPCPSPLPNPSPSLLKDISNFKTPKHRPKSPSFHSPCPHYLTASKRTPRSTSSFRRHRNSLAPSTSAARCRVARRLRAFELEQSKSARKAQIDKEKSLKSLSRSLTVWLNFLFQNPKSCGCDISKFTAQGGLRGSDGTVLTNGKRDSLPGGGIGVDWTWRSPKRQRDLSWRGVATVETSAFPSSMFSALQSSLQEVCSFDDLKQRMRVYLSLGSCKEICSVMTQVTKNIDEGRVKMKAHCPVVTDVGMKEKATRILMCYNPIWLRIGLYIIFGGDSLLPDGDVNSEQEIAFLRMVIEKQFFSHADLAKTYAYNKLVEGLYRPGYFDALGNVILKRFLLLVLILDRAKSQSSLPIKYGIDGLDGGSPLLFTLQSSIKSSSQVIHDFLSSDVMHGEGNLLAHLVIVGYKVSYQQSPLIEYDFKVTDLFEDLQDGIRLCRAIQLLQHDSSILMKMVVPSDTRKKSTSNCGIALQYLRQVDVPLYDEDGSVIIEEDIANGDKELTISLLWNMFVHLQLPLLISKRLLSEEISKIRRVPVELYLTSSLLDMLLTWIQAISESYDLKVDNFASLIDGKAMWCLLDYYFRKELRCSCSSKDLNETNKEASIMSATDYTDAVHNFILSQKLTTLLGNFPEVLQVGDILEHNGACNDRSVVILLVFLSFQLIVKKNTDQLNFHKLMGFTCQDLERKHLNTDRWLVHMEAVPNREETCGNFAEDSLRNFKVIMAWWQEMALRNNKCGFKPATPTLASFSTGRLSTNIQRENAAKIIQSYFRRLVDRRNYLQIKEAASFLQTVVRIVLTARKRSSVNKFSASKVQESSYQSELIGRYMTMVDRHDFVNLNRSAIIIQHAVRAWISERPHCRSILVQNVSTSHLSNAAVVIQKCIRGWRGRSIFSHRVAEIGKDSLAFDDNKVSEFQRKAATKIQLAWKKYVVVKYLFYQQLAATKIQCYFRGWLLRKIFLTEKQATIKIQSIFRCLRCRRDYQKCKITVRSALLIQSHVRGWLARTEVYRHRRLIIVIQSHFRGWLIRRELLSQRTAATRIQAAFRCIKYFKEFHCFIHAALHIQRFIRGQVSRRKLLGAYCLHKAVPASCIFKPAEGCFQSLELKIILQSVLKLQSWWRDVLLLRSRAKSALIIQSCIRGWIARQKANRERKHIIMIQSYWKGYVARKDSKRHLVDLRLRMQKSAANVDDGRRIINRLLAALSELLTVKSISGILHICETLDIATKHSQKCCEELVAAGAVDTLLKLIRSVSRSIPDQEVLKYALSTLRNLARYPHLTEVLIDSHGSVQTILWELLRNKEGYFIASELLKKMCSCQKGVESVRNLTALLKRLHGLAEDLTRKTASEKRNARSNPVVREQTERRLNEAIELLKLIKTNQSRF